MSAATQPGPAPVKTWPRGRSLTYDEFVEIHGEPKIVAEAKAKVMEDLADRKYIETVR